jgi:hypothetical protein
LKGFEFELQNDRILIMNCAGLDVRDREVQLIPRACTLRLIMNY